MILENLLADLEEIRAGDGDVHRDIGTGVVVTEEIRDAAAPADFFRRVGDGCLPLHLLVVVRKEVWGDGRSAREILGLGDGSDEGADVADHGHLP